MGTENREPNTGRGLLDALAAACPASRTPDLGLRAETKQPPAPEAGP